MGILPIYWQSARYAIEHGEREAYSASKKASLACRDAIENAASEHYRDNRLDTDAILDTVVPEFGYERVMLVLAATVRAKNWDDRFSRANKAWAKTMRLPEDRSVEGYDRYAEYTVNRTHSCLTDMLVSFARKYLPKRCYSILPGTGELITVKRGESGYYRCDFSTSSKEANRALADDFNKGLGVSKAQAAAMFHGSMFGWSVPAADPRNYGKDGKPLRPERGRLDMER